MKLKRLAVRGLIWLIVIVALCMFFAGTVQTITTPKVNLITASKGRLEKESSYTGEVYFPETEEIFVTEAKQSPITVLRVDVKVGQFVHKGDLLFTAEVTGYEEEMKKLREEYSGKNEELNALDITNRKLSRSSRQNELYEDMVTAQDIYASLAYQARVIAARLDITLLDEASDWGKQLSLLENVPDELLEAVDAAVAAQKTMEEGETAFYAMYQDKKLRVSDEVFNYIRDRNKLIKGMNELTASMLELDLRADALSEIRAERDGWIVSVDVEEGTGYEGVKAALVMSKEGTGPAIRAVITGAEGSFAEGTKVTVVLPDGSKEKSSVTGTKTTAEGRYMMVALPEVLEGDGNAKIRSILNENTLDVTISSRAKTATSLIPASAIRTEGDSYYVYVASETSGGLLSSAGLKLTKTTVTVIDHNDRQYAVNEDMSYQKIACQEDRALSDGCTVMEYVK